MNLATLFNYSAERYPDRPAFIWGEREWSYSESQRRIQSLARAMQGLGIAKGDRVAILQLNCPQLAETLLACLNLGVGAVPLNARFHPDEIPYYLNDSGASAIIFGPQYAENMRAMPEKAEAVMRYICLENPLDGQLDYEILISDNDTDEVHTVSVDADKDLAWLFYTSGTTGVSKGAMLTHAVLNYMTVSYLADLLNLGPNDSIIHAAPMTHGSGLQMFAVLARGGANVIPATQKFDPPEMCALIEGHRITNLFVSPTMIRMMLDEPAFDQHDLSSLRYVIYGGSVIHLKDLKEAIRRFGPVLLQIFGQGETPMTGTYLPREEHVLDGTPEQEKRLMSAGVSRTGIECRMFDENDQEVPRGELGELVIRGPSVMPSYWNKPEATAETLRNGWLHTGDIGYMDEAGYIFLMDRIKDMIISGGANIYPREIEEVLIQHPAVREVAVIGVPDRKWNESVHAVVVTTPGATTDADELIAFCKDHLASYKKPKSVSFVDNLPKSAYGKVLKRELRAPYWEGHKRRL